MSNSALRGYCRRGLTGIVVLLLGLACATSAKAQSNTFGAPSIARPTTSPYLNLFRRNNSALNFGLNYQRLVRPEMDLRRNAANTNTRVGTLQQQVNSAIAPDGSILLPGTGHQTSFLNTQGYFSNSGGGYGGSAGRGSSSRTNPSVGRPTPRR